MVSLLLFAVDDLRYVHFVEADVQTDGAGHEKVIVLARDSTIGTILFSFVEEIFIKTACVAFGVEVVADDFNESGNDFLFGFYVGVVSILARFAFPNVPFALTTCIEIWVDILDLFEDEDGLVAIHVAVAVFSLECVAFDDEECVVVEGGYLCRLPSKNIHINMTVPLSNDRRTTTINEVDAVENTDNGEVGLRGATTDVDHDKVAVGDNFSRVDFGKCPNIESTCTVFFEANVLQCEFPFINRSVDITDKFRWTTSGIELLHLVAVEYVRT